jgi:hypothetical protein
MNKLDDFSMKLASLTLHLGITSLHALAIVHTIVEYLMPSSKSELPPHIIANGFIFKYLTYWTLIMHVLTFGVSLMVDIMHECNIRHRLIPIRDFWFNSLALPFGCIVTTTF